MLGTAMGRNTRTQGIELSRRVRGEEGERSKGVVWLNDKNINVSENKPKKIEKNTNY